MKCVEVARSIRSRSSIYSESAESIRLERDSLLHDADGSEAKYQTSDVADIEDTEFDDLISSSASPAHPISQGESMSPGSSRNLDSVVAEDDDPDPDFDDATPREVLDVLISKYKKQIQVEMDDVCYAKAEKYQRKMIECARESNKAYDSDYNVQEMRRDLAEILCKIGDDRSRQEAKDINTSLFKPTQRSPVVPQIFPVALKPESERLELAKLYLQRAEFGYQEYHNTFNDLKALESSEKYAKRTLKLTLGLKDGGKQLLLQSVGHLIKGISSFILTRKEVPTPGLQILRILTSSRGSWRLRGAHTS